MLPHMQLGPRLASCALEIAIRLPLTGRGLPASIRAAPIALRRVQRVSSGIVVHEFAELAEEIAEDVASTVPGMADVVCLVVVLAAAAAWWKGGGKEATRRIRRRLAHGTCCQLWARWQRTQFVI